MADISKIILYMLVAVLAIVIAFSVYNYIKKTSSNIDYNSAEFNKALAAQDPLDKCKTPAGYTDESWREHMGHHPDMYKECLPN